MKLDTKSLAVAAAIGAAFLYALCWAIVAIVPDLAKRVTTDMLHMDVDAIAWQLDLESLLVGVVGWGVACGVAGCLVAWLYNRLVSRVRASSLPRAEG